MGRDASRRYSARSARAELEVPGVRVRRLGATNPKTLRPHIVVGKYRDAPEFVKTQQRVVDRVKQDRVGACAAGRVVMVEASPNRGDILDMEEHFESLLALADELESDLARG